jgi:sirohydrochlorin ferrochelatase
VTSPPLVAVAHGSRDPAAAEATRALLAGVRQARPELSVREAYLEHSQPRLGELAGSLDEPFVVVPLLLGAAYHSSVDIPSALATATVRAAQAQVLGPHPLLRAALERRLREVGVVTGDPSVGVVVAAAGSAEDSSVEAVRDLAQAWRDAGWWAVVPAFASAAEPSVEQAVTDLRAAGAPRVAVASYLLFPGLFADKLAVAGADVTSAPLGDAPEVVALVLLRYDEAAGRS